MTVLAFTALIFLGSVVAGFLGALTGLGGGVVIVPLLALVFGVDLRYAIGAYMAAPLALRVAARASRFLGWALASSFVQEFVKKRVRAGPPGPTAEARALRKSYLWGEVTDSVGNKAESRLQGPEAYSFTVRTALAVVERVLAGQTPAGFQTPSMAFGPDFVLHVEGNGSR